jgi:ABC-type nitrate/sulfonate/bicarbonate transport system substrate-binding protein
MLGRSRTTVLATRTTVLGLTTALLAACGGGGGGETSGSEASPAGEGAPIDSVRLAYTSSVDPGEVAFYAAAPEFGEEFGLAQDVGDLQVFESHGTAAQVVLSGGADVVAGSFLSDLQIIASGEPLRVFCPASSGFDSRLVGVNDVDSIEQIADPATRLAIEGPGGPVNFFTDLVLRARGVDINTTEMTNVSIIEDSPLRVAALANGDVDVALINAFQVPQLEEQIGAENVHILSNVMEDVGGGGIFLAFAASQEYLDQNLEEATAFCASVLRSNRALAADFDKYREVADKYIEPDVEEELLRQTWESVVDATLWPYNNGLAQEGVEQVIDIALETGLLEEELAYEDIVDTRPIEGALEMLGGEVDLATIKNEAAG